MPGVVQLLNCELILMNLSISMLNKPLPLVMVKRKITLIFKNGCTLVVELKPLSYKTQVTNNDNFVSLLGAAFV